MDQLRVLLIENRPGAGALAADELRRAGHCVERCHEPGQAAFPCRGLLDPAACPIDRVDVAVSVRHRVTPRPTELEDGVRCALRVGVPVVEDGPDRLDPFQPWLSGRVDGDDLTAACRRAIRRRMRPLEDRLRVLTEPLLGEAGVDAGSIDWSIELHRGRMKVCGRGPRLDDRLRARVGVRALEVARGMATRPHSVDVSYVTDPD